MVDTDDTETDDGRQTTSGVWHNFNYTCVQYLRILLSSFGEKWRPLKKILKVL